MVHFRRIYAIALYLCIKMLRTHGMKLSRILLPYFVLLWGFSVCGAETKPGLEDSITPMTRVTNASDQANWLARENLKKNATVDMIGEIVPASGKGVLCSMKIYIRPAPVAPPPPPPKNSKTPPPPSPPAPKAKTHTFTVYSDDKALAAYLKVLFSANLVPSMTLQGQFDDQDATHTEVETWKSFKVTKFITTSITLPQAREALAERERKNAEIRKGIADANTGGLSGLDKSKKDPKKDAPPKKEDKKLVDEEK